jgi:serine/threonine-protein kinase
MACVHFGRVTGPGGFARTVAVKRMHPHLAKDPEFAAMFVDEARLAARVRHPNVVATIDVLAVSDELLIVMEYVHGESLVELARRVRERKARIPPAIACAVVADVLSGLHAAHEATDERGNSLGIVHRDVGPENVLVGADGIARVLDFGVARAAGRLQVTREGQVKGKIAYMAPEQVRGGVISRSADVYAASVVMWEMLTGRRLFEAESDAHLVEKILYGAIEVPAAVAPSVPEPLNAIVLRGLARDPAARFATARDMMDALAQAVRPASASEVGDWVESIAHDRLAKRAAALATMGRADEGRETSTAVLEPTPFRDDTVESAPDAEGIRTTRKIGAPTAARHGRRVPRGAVLVLAVAVMAGVGLFVARLGVARSARDVATRAPVPSLHEVAVVSATPVPETGATSSSIVDMPSLPWDSVLPLPLAAASAKRFVDPAPPVRRRQPTAPPGPPRPSGHVGCDPPYTTDAEGTRHYKLECL